MCKYVRYPILILINTILIILYLLFELLFMMFGTSTLVNNYKFYDMPEYVYFYIVYGVVTSPIIIYYLVKGIYNLWCNSGLKTNILNIGLSTFRFISFVWGTYLIAKLSNNGEINNYKNNSNDLYKGLLNYYVLSCILTFLGIINFLINWYRDCKSDKISQDMKGNKEYQLLSMEEQV